MGGSSSSQANQTSTTNNVDKRIANDSGIAISSSGSKITVNTLDGGIVNKALDTVQVADASNADGFSKLLTLADKLNTTTQLSADRLANNAASLAGTYQNDVMQGISTATADNGGKLSQQTIVILAIAGAAVAGIALSKKR